MVNKYGARKTEYNGIMFDSKREATYARTFDILKKAVNEEDRIVEITYQPKFLLQSGFIDKNGVKHRPIHYISDFKLKYANGHEEIVDVKGKKTEIYKLKIKLFLKRYPDLNFREVY